LKRIAENFRSLASRHRHCHAPFVLCVKPDRLLALLEKKLGQPKDGWTNRNVIRAVARVGGFIGRKSDGEPGWQTIWRGWQRLLWMCEGANLIES
jgi:hypothetical protein